MYVDNKLFAPLNRMLNHPNKFTRVVGYLLTIPIGIAFMPLALLAVPYRSIYQKYHKIPKQFDMKD